MPRLVRTFFFALFFVQASLATEAIDKEWLRIGLYKGSLWGGYVSLISDPRYFLSPDGRRDPKAELEATIAAFRTPVTKDHINAEILEVTANPTNEQVQRALRAHPLCRFPARLDYILRTRPELNGQFPNIECGRLEAFRRRTNAAKISLVFSSYFMGNPASAFGHTMLRIHNKQFVNTESELLDSAIGFAANPTTGNPVLYAVYGLAGFFPASFTAEAYYRKVRAYNDQESRDLWSYTLDLKPDEVRALVNVIWEWASTQISYYYFTVNCGTLLMDLLDAAAPRLNLRDRIPFYVLPSDVVRAVNQEPGLVVAHGYRPSVRQQFENRFNLLNDTEREQFWKLLSTEDAAFLSTVPPEKRVRVLDAWADFIEYKNATKLVAGDPEASNLKQKALLARAEVLLPSAVDNSPPKDMAPNLAHPVKQVSLGVGKSRVLGAAIEARYRFALHGLTNADFGLPPNTELTFFEFGGSLYPESKPVFYLEDATFFRVMNLNPWKSYEKPFSFGAGLEMTTAPDPDFVTPVRGTELSLNGGFGVTLPLFTPKALFFVLLRARVAAGDYQVSWLRIGMGPQAGFLLHFSRRAKLFLEATSLYRFNGTNKNFTTGSGEFQYSFTNEWTTFLRFSANKVDSRVLGGFRFLY